MSWEVEYTDEFFEWWETLCEAQQNSISSSVKLLADVGPTLGFPHTSAILGSCQTKLRELRTQHRGQPLRALYAFDPRRTVILLLGGNKAGDDRWYDVTIPKAERLYEEHLIQLRKEGLING